MLTAVERKRGEGKKRSREGGMEDRRREGRGEGRRQEGKKEECQLIQMLFLQTGIA